MTFKADLKARWQMHRLEHHYKCKRCCDKCSAIQPFKSDFHAMSYKNTARDAPYATTLRDHDTYVLEAKHISPWCQVEGCQFETWSFDTMHLIYLGVARNHVPSCLKFLKIWGVYYQPGESDEMFLKRVSLEMKDDCKRNKNPVLIRSFFPF